MSDYFKIPLRQRLEAFHHNGKKCLGGEWFDGRKQWHWIPKSLSATGCWDGRVFNFGGNACRWCSDLSGYFRNLTEVKKIIQLRHTGWYVDCDQNETTRGLVLQLAGRKPRFMAACSDPWNDNSAIVAQSLFGDSEPCARSADRLAECFADGCREDALNQTAEYRIAQLRDEIAQTRERIRELIGGIRQSQLAPPVCDEMRASIRRLRAECQAAIARVARIQAHPEILVSR
jgi:hypothetical protein